MKNLIDSHKIYKETGLSKRRFKHDEVIRLAKSCGYEYSSVGNSFEGREILKVVAGKGKRKILLWSQMHGDESTATRAIFDILHFLKAENDGFEDFRNVILAELELSFVPMLNPDGAQRFQRRTAQEIDMNRDAVALQCPESKILKELVMTLKPEFSFNLHDQAIYYAAGEAPLQSAVAFLATAYNEETEWNDVRTKAMQVICSMNKGLQEIIPDRVGRFSDEFEPRAFGDNIQKWGSSLILVESGGYPDDQEKEFIRSLNFHAILQGLYAIALENYTENTLEQYEQIPVNNRSFLDLKITNVTVEHSSGAYVVDLGILLNEKNNIEATDFTLDSVIEEIGDLSVFHGIESFDAGFGVIRSVNEFPELIAEHDISYIPESIKLEEKATFVIDHGKTQTLVLNGKII